MVSETKNIVFPPPGYGPLKFRLIIPVLESEYWKYHKLSGTQISLTFPVFKSDTSTDDLLQSGLRQFGQEQLFGGER